MTLSADYGLTTPWFRLVVRSWRSEHCSVQNLTVGACAVSVEANALWKPFTPFQVWLRVVDDFNIQTRKWTLFRRETWLGQMRASEKLSRWGRINNTALFSGPVWFHIVVESQFYCQVLPMVWEIVYITPFRIRVNSSSSCSMLSKNVLFIAVLSLVKYLKRNVGNSFAFVTYMAETRK